MALHGNEFEALGAPWHQPLAFALPPPEILFAPHGVYGIAYDLSVHNMEDDPPDGWAKYRCTSITHLSIYLNLLTPISASIYAEIRDHMIAHGFEREQRSVWQADTTALFTWNTMLSLRGIRPRGVLATVLQRMEMFSIPHPHSFIVTNNLQLGGLYSPALLGPTPAGLSEGMGAPPPPPWPNGPGDRLPFGVRPGNASFN